MKQTMYNCCEGGKPERVGERGDLEGGGERRDLEIGGERGESEGAVIKNMGLEWELERGGER